jgi:hypothetical protein
MLILLDEFRPMYSILLGRDSLDMLEIFSGLLTILNGNPLGVPRFLQVNVKIMIFNFQIHNLI